MKEVSLKEFKMLPRGTLYHECYGKESPAREILVKTSTAGDNPLEGDPDVGMYAADPMDTELIERENGQEEYRVKDGLVESSNIGMWHGEEDSVKFLVYDREELANIIKNFQTCADLMDGKISKL